MWKILTSEVPNDLQVSFYMNQRSAIKAVIPRIPSQRSNTTPFDKSFSVIGPKLWNILPKDCTLAIDSLESFKRHLGVFMAEFQDLPPTSGYFSPNSNSLLDWFYSRSDGLWWITLGLKSRHYCQSKCEGVCLARGMLTGYINGLCLVWGCRFP